MGMKQNLFSKSKIFELWFGKLDADRLGRNFCKSSLLRNDIKNVYLSAPWTFTRCLFKFSKVSKSTNFTNIVPVRIRDLFLLGVKNWNVPSILTDMVFWSHRGCIYAKSFFHFDIGVLSIHIHAWKVHCNQYIETSLVLALNQEICSHCEFFQYAHSIFFLKQRQFCKWSI